MDLKKAFNYWFVEFMKKHPLPTGSIIYQPILMRFVITSRCNARCPHCYFIQQKEDFYDSEPVDISFNDFKKIFDYYAPKLTSITIEGGEAMLHPDIEKIIDYVTSVKVVCRFQTNGIALLQSIPKLVKLHGINVSLDAVEPESYVAKKGISNKRIFYKCLEGINKMVELKNSNKIALREISISFVVGKDNVHEIPKMIKLGERLGVDTVNLQSVADLGSLKSTTPIFKTDLNEVIKDILAREDYKVSINMPKEFSKENERFFCNSLFNQINLDYKGDFSPCCHVMTDAKYGNFYDSPESYNSPAIKQIRKSFIQKRIPDFCKLCSRRYRCRWKFDRHAKKWIYKETS